MPAEEDRPDNDGADCPDQEDCGGGQILGLSCQRMTLWFKQVDGALDRGVDGLSGQDQGDCGPQDEPFDCGELKRLVSGIVAGVILRKIGFWGPAG